MPAANISEFANLSDFLSLMSFASVVTPPTSVCLGLGTSTALSHILCFVARTYPVSGKFTSAQEELYSALLNVQKKMVTYCTESSNMSLADIHRESADMLQQELNKIGFNLRGTHGAGDIARVLYPHYVGHPIGVGMSSQLYILSFLTYSVKICTSQAITTETEV